MKTKSMPALCSLAALAGILLILPAASAAQAPFEGTLNVTKGEKGKIDTAEFKCTLKGEEVTLPVLVDKTVRQMAEESDGGILQVVGSVFNRKGEKWLKVRSFSHVFIGMVTTDRDDKKDVTGGRVRDEKSGTTHSVIPGKAGLKLLTDLDGKRAYVIGKFLKKKGKTLLMVTSCFPVETLEGTVETKEDKKKNPVAAWLVVTADNKKVRYAIVLDSLGQGIMATEKGAKISATSSIVKKGKQVKIHDYKKGD